MKYIIIRHGQDHYNKKRVLNGWMNSHLTLTGLWQAIKVGWALRSFNLNINAVYSSPHFRTLETALTVMIINLLFRPFRIDSRLLERDFGEMTGVPHSMIDKKYKGEILDNGKIKYFLEPEGGETFPQLLERIQRFRYKVEQIDKPLNAILVTSGDTAKAFIADFLSLDWEDVLMGFHMGNSEIIVLEDTNETLEEIQAYKQNQFSKW